MVDKTLGTAVRQQLAQMLEGGQAHATFEAAVNGLPANLRGVVPDGLPYSAWQIVEHIRIAQRDILDFSRNTDGKYKPGKWPDDYWSNDAEPPSDTAWDNCVQQIDEDRTAFETLLKQADDKELVTPFAWGDGQNLLREALLIADHAAYHTGELIVLRRLLGAWKK
jgi:uncharacterized damage-inducible protein DinB